jgi:hypothetical protein
MFVEGIRTKTVSIEITSNIFSYQFANQDRYLGMPPDAYILAIFARQPLNYPVDRDKF